MIYKHLKEKKYKLKMMNKDPIVAEIKLIETSAEECLF